MKRIYFNKEETKITKIKGYVEVDDEYIQIYKSMFSLTGKLKSITDFQLILFLAQSSNDSNLFYSNDWLFNKFNKILETEFKITITRMTFQRCLLNLVNAKIVIKLSRSQYQLNPFVIWKDSLTEREEHITEILESESIKPNYILENENQRTN